MSSEWRKRKILNESSAAGERSFPMDVSLDKTFNLVHPNGFCCEAGSRFWEYFQDALEYAERAQYWEEYKNAASLGGRSPLEAAAADFFRPPEILCIDLSRYRGRKGDIIGIAAFDSIKVCSVGVLILTPEKELLEMGTAVRSDGGMWLYSASKDLDAESVLVIVDAEDLPGHVTEKRLSKQLRQS